MSSGLLCGPFATASADRFFDIFSRDDSSITAGGDPRSHEKSNQSIPAKSNENFIDTSGVHSRRQSIGRFGHCLDSQSALGRWDGSGDTWLHLHLDSDDGGDDAACSDASCVVVCERSAVQNKVRFLPSANRNVCGWLSRNMGVDGGRSSPAKFRHRLSNE